MIAIKDQIVQLHIDKMVGDKGSGQRGLKLDRNVYMRQRHGWINTNLFSQDPVAALNAKR